MRNNTTKALLGATILGTLTWLGQPKDAVQESSAAPPGSGGTKQGRTWSCQGTSSPSECLLCCMDEAALLQAYCESFGVSESFCMRMAWDYLSLCQAHACGLV